MKTSRTLLRLIALCRPYKGKLALSFALLCFATLADVIVPILVKNFIDGPLIEGRVDRHVILDFAWLYMLLLVISAIMHFIQSCFLNRIAVDIVGDLRKRLYEKVLRRPVSFFDRRDTGALLSRITNDSESIKDLYVQVFATVVQNSMLIIGILTAMFFLDWRLACICFVFLCVVIIMMNVYQRMSSPIFHRTSSLLSTINTRLSEAISGMSILQVFNQQKRFEQGFSKTCDEHFQARYKAIRLNAWMLRPLIDFLYILSLTGILYTFGLFSLEGSFKIGVLNAFILYVGRFIEPLIEIATRLNIYQKAIVCGDRVFELLDEKSEDSKQQKNVQLENGEIEMDGVSFEYVKDIPILNGVSTHIPSGSMLGIVGPTGSGKSTLVQLLLKFYPIVKGDIRISGHSIKEIDNESLRKHMAIVEQDPFIFSSTIRENITMGQEYSSEAIEEAAKLAQCHEIIMKQDSAYDHFLGEGGKNWSHGERQLLSLARALVRKPKILILDEATASIDSETESLLSKAIEGLHGEVTVIVIAHRLSTIRHADEILVLNHGEIIERGDHRSLYNLNGYYSNLYQLQMSIKQRA